MSTTRPPQVRAPELTCDCHFHIFGPYDRFPLDSGRAWIKLASYRASSSWAPWTDVAPNVRALASAAPERCVWGTDWPHPGMDPAPEAGVLFDQFMAWVPDAAVRQRILVDNPARLYGF